MGQQYYKFADKDYSIILICPATFVLALFLCVCTGVAKIVSFYSRVTMNVRCVGMNSGVMLFRKSKWSLDFLEEVAKLGRTPEPSLEKVGPPVLLLNMLV